jgi:putative toxin-antitoxin system antitoxin component (TIGR02293 family)
MTAAALPRAPTPVQKAQPQDSRRAVWEILFRRHPEARARVRGEIEHFVFISNDVAHSIVREGVSGQVLAPLGDLLGLGPTQLAPVIGVDRTTARRYARDDQTLPKHSAETVLRLAELESLALDVFASAQDAHGWLKKPHPLLGESPIDAASTSYGAQRVREILTAIKYGGVV